MSNKSKVGRNDPCPCGSGKKYKNCCMSEEELRLEGFPYGLRMKGGIRYDPAVNGFVVIVPVWDNVGCRGEPKEWRYPEVYQNEDEALHYYKTAISPKLIRFLEKNSENRQGAKFIHRQLE